MKTMLLFILLSTTLFASEPITPIELPTSINYEKVKLGEKLFFDARLSRNDTIACASCHNLELGGDDGLQYSFGVEGKVGNINSPTVLNAVNNFRQFWDGRAKNLQEQVTGPIENPVEMNFTFEELIPKLQKTEYKELFAKVYEEGISKNSITDAIAEYEKTLVTPNAPFDKYLIGNKNALSQEQKDGYELFKSKGCISCHHGVNLGGNLYSKFGVVKSSETTALGRYNVTHKKRDMYYFKVPSLRNITLTAPYFHDGRTESLKEAIEIMSQLQLGRHFTKDEVQKIEAFFYALEGELPKGKEIYVP